MCIFVVSIVAVGGLAPLVANTSISTTRIESLRRSCESMVINKNVVAKIE